MDFDLYQETIKQRVEIKTGLPALVLFLGTASGDVQHTLAESLMNPDGLLSEEQLGEIVCNLGEVLRGVALIAEKLGYELSEIAAEDLSQR